MAIIKWEPMEELDKFFEGFPHSAMPTKMRGFVPAIDLYEDKTHVIAETALPGINPDDVEVSVADGVLTIKGTSKKESEIDEKNYYRKEVRSGSFYRQVALPTNVVTDKTSADYEDGILKVKMPKATEVKAKTVKINIKKS